MVHENIFPASPETHYVSVTKINR